jgi:hypothetical protein
MRRLVLISVGFAVGLLACANVPPRPGSDEEGQRFGELYLKTLRWEGPRASAALLAPELRREYLDRIKADKLEDKLKITEFEAKDLARTGQQTAALAADLSWYVEPEVTLHHELVTVDLRYGQGGWAVEGVEGGPIPLAPLTPPPAAPAPAAVDGGSP